jgi:hypothetical protein
MLNTHGGGDYLEDKAENGGSLRYNWVWGELSVLNWGFLKFPHGMGKMQEGDSNTASAKQWRSYSTAIT